jgi:long-chain acyl-CoA synthetase
LRKAAKELPCQFSQAYGMTEASPVLTIMSWKTHQEGFKAELGSIASRRLTSCGQPVLGVEVLIVNEAGQEVPVGEIGEIVARGPNITRGYWNKAEETAYGLREGWLHTGDLAYRDDQNFYYIVDRKKDMIISGGENIYSTEVENAIYSHPAVLEAAVIGVPDRTWGEKVHGIVVLKPGHNAGADEIIANCRKLIAGYKVPRSLEFIEALPKSGAGKILKRALRELYWPVQGSKVI